MRITGLLALAILVGCGSGGGAPEDDPNVFATEYAAYFTHDPALGTGGDGQTYYPAFIEYQRWDAETGEYFESWIVFQNGVRVTARVAAEAKSSDEAVEWANSIQLLDSRSTGETLIHVRFPTDRSQSSSPSTEPRASMV